MKKLFFLLCTFGASALLSSCTVTETTYTPAYTTSYVTTTTTTLDVDNPPYPGYSYYGGWYGGTPDYYDTTISVLDD